MVRLLNKHNYFYIMSAGLYMLIGERVGSSSGDETVIVAPSGHPVNLHYIKTGIAMGTLCCWL